MVNGDDEFSASALSYQGRPTTGLGKSESPVPSTGEDDSAPRKRLRRGGGGNVDDSAASSQFTSELATPAGESPAPGGEHSTGSNPGFTASLQTRLADFNVDSGPSSSASSAYGGNGGPSMQRNGSGMADETFASNSMGHQQGPPYQQQHVQSGMPPQQVMPQHNGQNGMRPGAPGSSTNYQAPAFMSTQSQDYFTGTAPNPAATAPTQSPPVGGTIPLAGHSNSPIIPPSIAGMQSMQAPMPGIDSAFDRFCHSIGTSFSRANAYHAWTTANRDQVGAVGLLVNAAPTPQQRQMQQRPQGAPHAMGYGPSSAAAAYAQVNSPLAAAGTPTHYAQQQMSGGRAPIQVMSRPVMVAQGTPQQMGGQAPGYRQPNPYYNSPQNGGGSPGPASPYAAASSAYTNAVLQLPQDHQQNYHRLIRKQQQGLATPHDMIALEQYKKHIESTRQKAMQIQAAQRAATAGIPQGQAFYQNGAPYGYQSYPGQSQFTVQGQQARGQRYQQPRPGYPNGQHPAQYSSPQSQPRPVKTYQAPQTSGSILARQLAAAAGSAPKKKRKRAAQSESEDDGGAYDSGGSGDEYGSAETPAQVQKRETLAVEFFNTCEKEMLMELAGANATQATLTMKLRPFTSASDFRLRTRKQKGVGNMMMETYLEVVSGMNEVDKVLNNCERIGAELSRVMRIWQSGAATTDPNVGVNTASDVGMNIVAISDEVYEQRVVPSQDPQVQAAFQGYLRRKPEGIPDTVTLKDYQMLGINWLNLLWNRRTSCILADEMGLGKTIQVIALLAHIKATKQPGPHLVVVPSSTLENWMREFSIFAPELKVETYYGSQSERADIRHELRQLEELDVVVTTYNIATSSPEDQKFLKKKMDFKVTVFDEGHQLKNSESKKYKDLMQIKAQWRLLLTGTPLQNNLQELVSLLSFILPDQFRDANDSLRAIFKVQPGQSANLLSRERVSRAKKMMTPFVLRRKKAQVLKDLPAKIERIEWCEMTDLQREVYQEALMRSKKALLDADKDEIEELGSEDDSGGEQLPEDEKPKPKPKGRKKKPAASTKTGNKADASSSTHVLTDLRKASNHPMLFRRIYDEKTLKLMARDCLKELEFVDRDKNLIFEDMEVMTDFELHRFCLGYKHLQEYALKNDEWMSAGKIHKLKEQLPKMKADGDRILLFSQFTQVLDILEVVLDTMGIKYIKLTGQTNVTERQGLCDLYTNDPEITVFLLSTRAGGLGLNLTAANTVIFYDQDYNPHNDKQAEDRAYRIGQKRDVHIIKYITKGSLEEDMRRLATNKLKLDSEVSGQDNNVAPIDDENNRHQVEKKMRTSLLSNLKKRFEGETQANQSAEGGSGPQPSTSTSTNTNVDVGKAEEPVEGAP